MSDGKPNPVLRLLPSLTDLAFLLPIVFLFTAMDGVKAMLGDGDTGYHIRAGEWILANGRVPDKDIFSFTKAGEPWFAWEWLWDAAFAWLHQRGGMALVVLASIVVIALTFALLFRLVRRNCSNDFIAILVTLLAAMASTIHWLARPHLFSLLFLVVFLSVLERAGDGRMRWLWWLPPLTILWTNLHGGFFLGIILVLSYAAGELISVVLEPDPGTRRRLVARSRPFLLAGVGCAAASFVNPYFYQLHAHIYSYLSDTYHLRNIAEFQSVSFHHPMAVYFEAITVLGSVAAFWSVYRRRYAHAILLVGFLHGALVSARNIPVYAIIAAPIVAMMLNEFLSRLEQGPVAAWVRHAAVSFRESAAEFGETDRAWRLHLASVAAVALVCILVYAPAPSSKFKAEYDPKRYPAKAVEVLRGQDRAGHVFTDDEWGDYLIYRLYPEGKVFVDGRSDFYGARFCEEYIDIMNVKYGWEGMLGRYGIGTVLLPVDAPLAGALKESRRWRPTYDDGVAIVFKTTAAGAWEGPGSERSSAAKSGGSPRDRKVAKTQNRDLRITKPNTRSEPL